VCLYFFLSIYCWTFCVCVCYSILTMGVRERFKIIINKNDKNSKSRVFFIVPSQSNIYYLWVTFHLTFSNNLHGHLSETIFRIDFWYELNQNMTLFLDTKWRADKKPKFWDVVSTEHNVMYPGKVKNVTKKRYLTNNKSNCLVIPKPNMYKRGPWISLLICRKDKILLLILRFQSRAKTKVFLLVLALFQSWFQWKHHFCFLELFDSRVRAIRRLSIFRIKANRPCSLRCYPEQENFPY
jgi:hypothetical protein